MANFRAVLQYEGTRYQGWQKQDKTENTIQGKLEVLLSRMDESEVQVNGSGRTDAGVHARGQVISFQLKNHKDPVQVQEYMNTYLPDDIAVIFCERASERFHARLNATGKKYNYFINNSKTKRVFDRKYVWDFSDQLDIDAMKEAAECLRGTYDFKAFTSSKKGKKSTARTINAIEIEVNEDNLITISFQGDGFLYHMVRILTGTLIEVGLHQKAPLDMKKIIESQDREQAGFLAPAKGLCLMEVFYH